MKTKRFIGNAYLVTLLVTLFSPLLINSVLAADTPIPESGTVAATADTTYPSDVSNVKAVAGDKMVTLSWDAATDNVGVTGYKIFYGTASVSSDTASYTKGPIDVKNVLTYDIKDLVNDTTYYFAVTAYDAAGNESEFYSTEVSATPKAPGSAGTAATTPAGADNIAPKVVSAMATYKNQVKVTFSEGIKLPATKPEAAFSIKDDFLGINIAVSKAELDATDKSNKTVLLTTADQKKSSKYILTAGIQIQDLAGNPIISGTSDTAFFNGTDLVQPAAPAVTTTTEPTKPAADAEPPKLVSVNALDSTTVEVVFSEPVVLLTNAAENFIITDAADNTKITNVTKVAISQNGTKATLTTDELKAQPYNLIVIKVKDIAGNAMDAQNSATTFNGVATAATTTTTTPAASSVEEAASNLVAKAMANMVANLSWSPKEDKLAGVANFVIYMSSDRGATYGQGVVLGKDSKNYNFTDLKSDVLYYFKLTTKDPAGNESAGLITTLSLPKTGPELAFLLLFSTGAGAVFTRKKKK